MAGRIRSIKPELLDDEAVTCLSDEAWRLWVSSWLLSDDYGNCRAGDKYLAALVWQDSSRSPRVAEILRELQRAARIVVYVNGSDRYLHIRNWEKHQRIDNAGKARVPSPEHEDSRTWEEPRGDSQKNAEVRDDSRVSPPDLRPPTSESDHRPPTTELPAQKTPAAPRGRKAKAESPELPGMSCTRAAFTAAIAAASGGRYVDSKPPVGCLFKLDGPRARVDALDLADKIGRWFAAGGEAFHADRGQLDGRRLVDIDAWIAHVEKWDGGPVIRDSNGQHGRPRVVGMAPKCGPAVAGDG